MRLLWNDGSGCGLEQLGSFERKQCPREVVIQRKLSSRYCGRKEVKTVLG